jgi:polysaccharide biosynthesis protein PslG
MLWPERRTGLVSLEMTRHTASRMTFALLIVILVAIGLIYQDVHPPIVQGEDRHTSSKHRSVTSQRLRSRHSVVFGIADPGLIREPAKVQESQLKAMRALGITSIRLGANWNSVQHAGPRAFNWKQLDREVQAAHSVGMPVDLVIDGCPPWAASAKARNDPDPAPASPAQYATWAAEVAARYARDDANTFEIWNEPNKRTSWQPAADPAAYTADLIAAYHAIKDVDPSAFVVSGGLAPSTTGHANYSPVDFLKAMYTYGAKGSFDAVGYHPYSYPELPDTFQPRSAWSQMAQTSPSVRSLMNSYGDSGMPIWLTEFGAPSNGPRGIGQAGQAAEFSQAITNAKKLSWIGALYLYTWKDSGTNPRVSRDWFGLLTAMGTPKLAYAAVAAGLK